MFFNVKLNFKVGFFWNFFDSSTPWGRKMHICKCITYFQLWTFQIHGTFLTQFDYANIAELSVRHCTALQGESKVVFRYWPALWNILTWILFWWNIVFRMIKWENISLSSRRLDMTQTKTFSRIEFIYWSPPTWLLEKKKLGFSINRIKNLKSHRGSALGFLVLK